MGRAGTAAPRQPSPPVHFYAFFTSSGTSVHLPGKAGGRKTSGRGRRQRCGTSQPGQRGLSTPQGAPCGPSGPGEPASAGRCRADPSGRSHPPLLTAATTASSLSSPPPRSGHLFPGAHAHCGPDPAARSVDVRGGLSQQAEARGEAHARSPVRSEPKASCAASPPSSEGNSESPGPRPTPRARSRRAWLCARIPRRLPTARPARPLRLHSPRARPLPALGTVGASQAPRQPRPAACLSHARPDRRARGAGRALFTHTGRPAPAGHPVLRPEVDARAPPALPGPPPLAGRTSCGGLVARLLLLRPLFRRRPARRLRRRGVRTGSLCFPEARRTVSVHVRVPEVPAGALSSARRAQGTHRPGR